MKKENEILGSLNDILGKIAWLRININSFDITYMNNVLEELETRFKRINKDNTGYNDKTALLVEIKTGYICMVNEFADKIIQINPNWFYQNHVGAFSLFFALRERSARYKK
jgi:hypothetical protein